MCCGLFAPTQFHFECCGVFDDSRLHLYICFFLRDVVKNMKPLWKVKERINRTSWKVSDVQIVRYSWAWVAKEKPNRPVADFFRSVPQESWS